MKSRKICNGKGDSIMFELQLINFDDCPQNLRMYGGLAGRKAGIVYNGTNYIVKYPQNLKDASMKNVVLSYSNAPVCEYLGSHIYEIMEIPVHETFLGKRQNKTVVACKDFLNHGDRLYEFREIKTTFESANEEQNDSVSLTSGTGVDLNEILLILNEHPIFNTLPEMKKRFWDMFIIDAFIGNSDRNNGNWGIISRFDGSLEIAPVYDNGNCLNNKWDDEKIQKFLNDKPMMETQAYKGVLCIYTENEKKINPFQYLAKTKNPDALNSFFTLYPKLAENKNKFDELIENTFLLSTNQKEFYKLLLNLRLKIFEKIYTDYANSSRKYKSKNKLPMLNRN